MQQLMCAHESPEWMRLISCLMYKFDIFEEIYIILLDGRLNMPLTVEIPIFHQSYTV